VTLQGLLNALDGLQECSGRVCILTANHRSLLDPAFYRQGRVDVQVEMPRMQSAALVEAMMVRFFKGAADTDVAAAAAKVLRCSRDGAVAPCVVQDLCMRCVDKGLQALLDMPDEQLLESFV
jgi:ATP-dependent 26S proteasome regulatory subunit